MPLTDDEVKEIEHRVLYPFLVRNGVLKADKVHSHLRCDRLEDSMSDTDRDDALQALLAGPPATGRDAEIADLRKRLAQLETAAQEEK